MSLTRGDRTKREVFRFSSSPPIRLVRVKATSPFEEQSFVPNPCSLKIASPFPRKTTARQHLQRGERHILKHADARLHLLR